ncbi:PiggyBac transposase uribo1 [Plakobranchus ocellatus]|uniref:PiggyBac transposase uribo1 n=1 Tax=Plakobranchus ocellatus TaxID=259542 RepID=A0AAV4CQL3_9GAST|nr:PiggyBac transposase uribo1 [Plakobranchus ocellatus]
MQDLAPVMNWVDDIVPQGIPSLVGQPQDLGLNVEHRQVHGKVQREAWLSAIHASKAHKMGPRFTAVKRLAHCVMKDLLVPYHHTNIRVAMDNFYTSVLLLCDLHYSGICAAGTVRSNRKFLPKDLLPKAVKLEKHRFHVVLAEQLMDTRDVCVCYLIIIALPRLAHCTIGQAGKSNNKSLILLEECAA